MKKLVIISVFALVLSLIENPAFAIQICGDVYPPPSSPGAMDCGDGVVNLFDIMKVIDIILGVEPTICELTHVDVPNGTPPYCGLPPEKSDCMGDGYVNIFDVLVVIDKALGKTNCCDYCFGEAECMIDEDCDDGNDCTDDTCNDYSCNNICNATSFDDPCCADPVCYDDDICEVSVSCTIKPEDVLVTDGDVLFQVDLCLDNQNDNVRSVQLVICEEIDGSPFDCLECVGCEVTDRTTEFTCSTNELPDGCCIVLLYIIGTGVINQDICSIIKVDYSFDARSCPFNECMTLHPINISVSAPNINEVDSAGLPGQVCFTDFDSDGILNDEDNCPAMPNGPDLGTCVIGDIGQSCINDNDCGGVPGSCSVNQGDSDGDEIGDTCDNCPYDADNDIDNDGICGDIDNCPDVANPNQEDGDNDGVGDICDLCTDLDGDEYGREGLDNSGCAYPEYDCDDNDYNINPGAIEVCNGKDDDCNTFIDEDLIQSCGTGVCQGTQTCSGGSWSNCSTYNNECNDCALCSAVGECNVLKTTSDVCRASVGICDVAEYCTGDSPVCPPDSYQPDGTACDDDDVCNGHEICQAGVCTAGVPLNCDDYNFCTNDSCDPLAGCVYTNNTNPCNDDIICTENDVCSDGECNGTPNNNLCDDSNVCTDDICDIPLGCIYINNSDPCNDDIFCNGTDTCSSGTCSFHPGDPCPPLFCNEGLDMCIDLSDNDDDGIRDDGDNSGTHGDHPCTGGEAANCDDNCSSTPNGPLLGTCAKQVNENLVMITWNLCEDDGDCGEGEYCDNQGDYNENGIGDACECESDFDCDNAVDWDDVFTFIGDWGRNLDYNSCPPCEPENEPCEGDFDGDCDIDWDDILKFLEDWGRNPDDRPCPACP
jgi:hypothetical protein